MARNTILLRGNAREEAGTSVYDVTPGMLVEITDEDTYQPHATDGGQAFPIFVRASHENQGADIDTDIAAAGEFVVVFPEQGAALNAFTEETISAGDTVCSDGGGGVRVADSGDYVIGVARKDSDLSGDVGRCEIVVAALGVSA